MDVAGEIAEQHDAVPANDTPPESIMPARTPENRRTRLAGRKDRGGPRPNLPPKLHNWLIRTTQVHAHLCYCVRAFGRPPADTPGDTVEARAERRDRTLLYDFWSHAIRELTQLQNELAADMEPQAATSHTPGTAEIGRAHV